MAMTPTNRLGLTPDTLAEVTELSARPTRHPAGAAWEQAACDYLREQGLRLLQENYRCRMGEIDLVMRDGSCLVFVEVRYRRHVNFGGGLGSVTVAKQRRMARVASHFLQRHARLADRPCRFDVVAVSGSLERPHIDWIAHAFEDPR